MKINKNTIPLIAIIIPFIYLTPKSISYLFIPILLLILSVIHSDIIYKFFYKKITLLFFLSLSLFFVIATSSNPNIIRYIPILMLITLFNYKNISTSHISKVVIASTLLLITSQIGIAYDISFFINVRNNFYPIELDLWSAEHLSSGFSFRESRYGGIYYNPNVMGQMLSILLVTSLLAEQNMRLKAIISSAIIISIILTGSRTALIVSLITIAWFIHTNIKHKLTSYFLILSGIVGIIIIGGAFIESLQQGVFESDGSANIKFTILMQYLQEHTQTWNGLTKILLGSGSHDDLIFDSDYGDIIGHFGLMGFLIIIAFLYILYKNLPYENKFVFSIILFMFGNTLLYNLQASIGFFVILVLAFNSPPYKTQ